MTQPPEDFHAEPEAALYNMLKTVLQNHITTHHLGFSQVFAACLPVLGFVLYGIVDQPGADPQKEAPALIQRTITDVKQRVRARTAQPPALAIQDVPGEHVVSPATEVLGNALAGLLNEYAEEYHLRVMAVWRAYNAVVADVLTVPIHTGFLALEEAESTLEGLAETLAQFIREQEAYYQQHQRRS
jgi:hypothetical protein